MMATEYRVGVMLGRLASGAEADSGIRRHAVARKRVTRPPCPFNDWGQKRDSATDTIDADVAVCGAKPGRRSIGWSFDETVVTCPRCLARLARKES